LHRCFLGDHDDDGGGGWDERTAHYYRTSDGDGIEWHINHALTQGSPESSMLEALVYAHFARGAPPTAARALSLSESEGESMADTPQAAADTVVSQGAPAAGATPSRALFAATRVLDFHDDGIVLRGQDAGPSHFDITIDPATGAVPAPEKARATGLIADQLCTLGLANSANEPNPAVLGIPIGPDPAAWVRDVFRPRVMARIDTLRALGDDAGNRHLAMVAAVVSGGPAAMAHHWMAATEPSEAISAHLAAIDAAWEDLWLHFVGEPPAASAADAATHARVCRRLYAPRPDALGFIRCASAHHAAHAQGVLRALEPLRRMLNRPPDGDERDDEEAPAAEREGLCDELLAAAVALEAKLPANGGGSFPSARALFNALLRCASRYAAHCQAIRDGDALAAASAVASDAHGALSTGAHAPDAPEAFVMPLADRAARINLLVAALCQPAEPRLGDRAVSDRDAITIARRLFGLRALPLAPHDPRPPTDDAAALVPADRVGPSLPRPCRCLRGCTAEVASNFGKSDSDDRPNDRPATFVDDRLDHALACRQHAAATFERHQTIARAVMRLAHDAGWVATLDSSSLNRCIRLGEDAPDDAAPPGAARRTNRLRPGDVVIYSRDDPSRTTAVDVTVSCGKSSSADAAEKRKIGHYTDTVANTPGLVFIPFGLTVEGELGQGAYGLVRRIARSIARRQESVMDDSSAFAHTKARLAAMRWPSLWLPRSTTTSARGCQVTPERRPPRPRCNGSEKTAKDCRYLEVLEEGRRRETSAPEKDG
jgi:hypothetical protein